MYSGKNHHVEKMVLDHESYLNGSLKWGSDLNRGY